MRLKLLRFATMACIAAFLGVGSLSARAADDDETPPDPRLENFHEPQDAKLSQFEKNAPKPVALRGGGQALSWLLLLVLVGLAAGVMFKSSRRTHLD